MSAARSSRRQPGTAALVVLVMLGLAASASCALAQEPLTPQQSRLGINLAGLADWNTELPFVDVFRLSRHWISQRQGERWGKGPELALDERGWVTRLEPGCWADTPLCTIPMHYAHLGMRGGSRRQCPEVG